MELTGAEAALVVNNGAGAVLLAVAALGAARACCGLPGQLVEIGGGFRIPEVIAQSGARLIEVGTTNRTRLEDYRRAIAAADEPPAAILRVHQSNFRTIGFVEDISVEELCQLGLPGHRRRRLRSVHRSRSSPRSRTSPRSRPRSRRAQRSCAALAKQYATSRGAGKARAVLLKGPGDKGANSASPDHGPPDGAMPGRQIPL